MDTIVVWYYLKRWYSIGVSISLLLLLFSCPGEDMDCNDFGSIAEIPDLIHITPEQEVYTVDDEVTLRVEIPAVNDYYGMERNLFNLTGDESARLVLNFDQIFIGNQLTFIKGSQSEYSNWFEMPYNPTEGFYELELKVNFSQIGNYSFGSFGTVTIQGADFCNRFFIDTTVPWNITNGRIEFTVTE